MQTTIYSRAHRIRWKLSDSLFLNKIANFELQEQLSGELIVAVLSFFMEEV